MGAVDWEKLSCAVLEYLGGPVTFAEFIGIAAWILGVESYIPEELGEQVSPAPSPESAAAAIEILRALWLEILRLDLRWRRAFLLNPLLSRLIFGAERGT